MEKKCEICGKETKHIAQAYGYILCQKHYAQYRKYGKFLDNSTTSCFDKNRIIRYDDYAEIVLTNRSNQEVARAIIDLDDVDKCSI